MRADYLSVVASACSIAAGVPTMSMAEASVAQTTPSPAHVSNGFHFVIPASVDRAAALFGPEGERCWAGEHWNPIFLYPQPAKDTEGAVFTVSHGSHNSVWVNTVFDPSGGRVQYVSFIEGALVSVVDVRLSSLAPASTRVEVTYIRTALDVAVNEEVRAMGKDDAESGPYWQHAIEGCLNSETTR